MKALMFRRFVFAGITLCGVTFLSAAAEVPGGEAFLKPCSPFYHTGTGNFDTGVLYYHKVFILK
jgi:hypothetical protein